LAGDARSRWLKPRCQFDGGSTVQAEVPGAALTGWLGALGAGGLTFLYVGKNGTHPRWPHTKHPRAGGAWGDRMFFVEVRMAIWVAANIATTVTGWRRVGNARLISRTLTPSTLIWRTVLLHCRLVTTITR